MINRNNKLFIIIMTKSMPETNIERLQKFAKDRVNKYSKNCHLSMYEEDKQELKKIGKKYRESQHQIMSDYEWQGIK